MSLKTCMERKELITERAYKEKVNHKCKVILQSKKDKSFQKDKKKNEGTWIGCDEDGYGF